MVGVDGKDTVSADHTCFECRGYPLFSHADIVVRARLLFGYLPVGRIPGCGFMVERTSQKEEIPFFLFLRAILAALWCFGIIHGRCYRGIGVVCRTAGSLQCLWTNCFQSTPTRLFMGKQPACLLFGKGRQLYVLFGGCMDGGIADDDSGFGNPNLAGHIGMAKRTNLL